MSERILIICFSQLHKDPRVLNQINALKNTYQVVTAGYSASGYAEVSQHFNTPIHASSTIFGKAARLLQLLSRQFEKYYWNVRKKELFEQLKGKRFRLIIANDLEALPFCADLAKKTGAKLIFDAHEYYPAHFQDVWWWRILFQPFQHYLCKQYFRFIDEFLVVGENIGELYKQNYGVAAYTVITNAPPFEDLSPSAVNEQVRIIHHGNANPSRNIEEMIRLLDFLPGNYELHLMLVKSDLRYYRKLKKAAEGKNVKFPDPVPTSDIVTYINRFDIGLYLLPPASFNSKYALPNKFFEFIHARLMIAIGPSVEMKSIVEKYDLGVVAKNFSAEAMAEKIRTLSREDIMRYKQRTSKAAVEFNAGHNAKLLQEIVSKN